LALALGLDPEAALAFSIENCSITRMDRIDGLGMGHGWRVVTVNRPPRRKTGSKAVNLNGRRDYTQIGINRTPSD
jgi:hypothetical protein